MLEIIKFQQQQQIELQKTFQERQLEIEKTFQERQLQTKQKLIEVQKSQLEQQASNHASQLEQQASNHAFLMKAITDRGQNADNENAFTQNAIWTAIETFTYAPDEDISFESYYRRYEDLYSTDCATWTDSKKVRLLLRKLGTTEHTRFVDYILP